MLNFTEQEIKVLERVLEMNKSMLVLEEINNIAYAHIEKLVLQVKVSRNFRFQADSVEIENSIIAKLEQHLIDIEPFDFISAAKNYNFDEFD